MILNSGLDAACTNNAIADGSSPDRRPSFSAFIMYAAFGTGSTAPSVTDTSLGAQVGSRSNNDGGFNYSETSGLDSTNDLIWYEGTFTRAFTIDSPVNATEWGLSAASTGNLSVRELFRTDPNDNSSLAVTLTLDSGDELQLVITLRVQADWQYVSKSFVVTGTAGNDAAGTHTGNASVSTGTATTTVEITSALSSAWPGGATGTASYLNVFTSDKSSVAINQNLSTAATFATMTNAAYTPGNHYVDCSCTFGTSAANGDHYAWSVVANSHYTYASWGYRFILTSPAKLTKASTHKLSLTVRKSIARL